MKIYLDDDFIFYGSLRVPKNVSKDMIGLLDKHNFFEPPSADITPEQYIETHRVIDVYCQSLSLVNEVHNRFMVSLCIVIPDEFKRSIFIKRNLIFALCPNVVMRDIFAKIFYGVAQTGNFYVYDIKENGGLDEVKVKELIHSMKFQVVIGNPPYTRDIFIDFISKGYDISDKYSIWIVPARWGSRPNAKELRNKVGKHISKSVWYVESNEVFDKVNAWGGISYFCLDKTQEYDAFPSETKCMKVQGLNGEYNAVVQKYINWCWFSDMILSRLPNFKPMCLRCNTNDEYFLHLPNTFNTCATGLGNCEDTSIFVFSPMSISKSYRYVDNDAILYSGDYKTVESVKSYFETRFIRFLMFIGLNIQHPFTKGVCSETNSSSLRFVPQPDVFDHIFTDEELYKQYNLTEDEINVIESVVKDVNDRK